MLCFTRLNRTLVCPSVPHTRHTTHTSIPRIDAVSHPRLSQTDTLVTAPRLAVQEQYVTLTLCLTSHHTWSHYTSPPRFLPVPASLHPEGLISGVERPPQPSQRNHGRRTFTSLISGGAAFGSWSMVKVGLVRSGRVDAVVGLGSDLDVVLAGLSML